MTRTIDEIAEALEIPRPAADGLVKYLTAVGLARFRGERPSQRGKGPHVYEVMPGAGKAIGAAVERLE